MVLRPKKAQSYHEATLLFEDPKGVVVPHSLESEEPFFLWLHLRAAGTCENKGAQKQSLDNWTTPWLTTRKEQRILTAAPSPSFNIPEAESSPC